MMNLAIFDEAMTSDAIFFGNRPISLYYYIFGVLNSQGSVTTLIRWGGWCHAVTCDVHL